MEKSSRPLNERREVELTTPLAQIILERLPHVDTQALMSLMNDEAVRRHLPLAKGAFTVESCEQFVEEKERMWREVGYGPWAILRNRKFVGWGGLQPEGDDVDIALVLSPDSWGIGRALFQYFLSMAFHEHQVESVVSLLPETRTRGGGLTRLGFERDGTAEVGGVRFAKFRLHRSTWSSSAAPAKA